MASDGELTTTSLQLYLGYISNISRKLG